MPFSVGDVLREGWEAFQKNAGPVIGGYFAMLGIMLVINFIPFINFLSAFFINPAFTGGYSLLMLNTSRDSNPSVSNIFDGFHKYGSLIGLNFLYVLFFVCAMAPTIIIGLISINSRAMRGSEDVVVLVGIINFIVLIAILIRFAFVYFIIMDEADISVIDALKKSAALMKGNYGNVIAFAIVSCLLILAGLILLIIPGLIAGWVVGIAWARVYLKFKENYEKNPGLVLPDTPPINPV